MRHWSIATYKKRCHSPAPLSFFLFQDSIIHSSCYDESSNHPEAQRSLISSLVQRPSRSSLSSTSSFALLCTSLRLLYSFFADFILILSKAFAHFSLSLVAAPSQREFSTNLLSQSKELERRRLILCLGGGGHQLGWFLSPLLSSMARGVPDAADALLSASDSSERQWSSGTCVLPSPVVAPPVR